MAWSSTGIAFCRCLFLRVFDFASLLLNCFANSDVLFVSEMVKKPSKVKKNNAVHRDCLDVTNEFFSKCSGMPSIFFSKILLDLKNHEIVLTDDVKLPDLMNCIEMMDGKNDVSVHQNSNHNISIDSLIKKVSIFLNLPPFRAFSII